MAAVKWPFGIQRVDHLFSLHTDLERNTGRCVGGGVGVSAVCRHTRLNNIFLVGLPMKSYSSSSIEGCRHECNFFGLATIVPDEIGNYQSHLKIT